eukprot:127318-Ditylum_brightwellii.AAC.1
MRQEKTLSSVRPILVNCWGRGVQGQDCPSSDAKVAVVPVIIADTVGSLAGTRSVGRLVVVDTQDEVDREDS